MENIRDISDVKEKTEDVQMTELKNGVYFFTTAKGENLWLKYPTAEDTMISQAIYQKAYMKYKRTDEFLTKKELEEFHAENGNWNEDKEKEIEDLEKRTDELDQDIIRLSESTGITDFDIFAKNFEKETKDMDKRSTKYKLRKDLLETLEMREENQRKRYVLLMVKMQLFNGCIETLAKIEQDRYLMTKTLFKNNPEGEFVPAYTIEEIRDMQLNDWTFLMAKWQTEIGRYAKI